MSEAHSAHIVDLTQIDGFRQWVSTTPMLQVGMRCAVLDALDRWQHEMPLDFMVCVIAPNGTVSMSMCGESRLESTILAHLDDIANALCAWELEFIDDRAKMIWEDAADLFEFAYPSVGRNAPVGVTLH